jgi:hypothetical protein
MVIYSRLDEFIVARHSRVVIVGLLLPRDKFINSVIYVCSIEKFRFYGGKI